MDTSLTRRAPLTGADASVAALMPAIHTDHVAWDSGLARYQASFAAAEANGWEDDDLASAQCDDWSALMHTPAPHIKALHWKLDHLYGTPERDGTTTQWDFGLVSVVVDDARRLAGLEAAA